MEAEVARILVVDDEADARASIRVTLEENGFIVLEASNGKMALNYLTSNLPAPCLILLDLRMPEMTGWELAALIKAYSPLAQIPVVVMTALDPYPKLLSGRAAAILKKPFPGDELLATIAAALVPAKSPPES